MALLVGQYLGNYYISEHLGQGGYADVYRCEHKYLKVERAIKVAQIQRSTYGMLAAETRNMCIEVIADRFAPLYGLQTASGSRPQGQTDSCISGMLTMVAMCLSTTHIGLGL